MQKINILGVELTDHPLKESLALTESYSQGGVCSTVLYVTTPMLMLAGSDAEEKRWIEEMDLTLCGEADILKAAGIESVGRLYEVENLVFLKEFLRRMEQADKKIYLLADSEKELALLENELTAFRPGLSIVGYSLLTAETQNIEEIINKINDIAPAAVISRLPAGLQERSMSEAKPLVNAKVWLGISRDMILDGTKKTVHRRILSEIYKRIFRRRINRFSDNNRKE
ncbi:MAG: WecB/TagA/CpsF family glycosyltransferase [Lachnospiraceae bacterium]|nr:WecB/TagA/CpsF family glycosyltransferase [Lachnospiraceae bacterium]